MWRSDLPTYEEVRLGEVWKGVHVSLHARRAGIEEVFTVAPFARPENIRIQLRDARSVRIDPAGELVARIGGHEVRFSRPIAYQERGDARQTVAAAYVWNGNTYGFRLGSYERALPVIIDPLLQATYLGGAGFDRINAIAVHPTTGEILVAGHTASSDFPGTAGGAQTAFVGPAPGYDAFVARFDPTLRTLRQATYLGGGGAGTLDSAQSLAVDPATGNVLVGGQTGSTDFPGTAGGAQPTAGGAGDGFLACLDPTLKTLLAATYLGGSGAYEFVSAIAVHPATHELLVVGETDSADFPGTAGGAQPATAGGGGDVFVARLNLSLNSLLQATYLGGRGYEDLGLDAFSALAVDPATGDVFVGGVTGSSDFPGTVGGAQFAIAGGSDGFVARLNANLNHLEQATYLGGSEADDVTLVAFHPLTGEIVVAGGTQSTDLPGTAGGALPEYSGGPSGLYVARLDAQLTTLRRATYFGGGAINEVDAMVVHPTTGDVLIAGLTQSEDIPGTTGAIQTENAGAYDGFVVRFDAALTSLGQATYLGGTNDDGAHGLAVDPETGYVLVAGGTSSTNFPGTEGGAQPAAAGSVNGFVACVTPDLAEVVPTERLPVLPVNRSRPPLRTITRSP